MKRLICGQEISFEGPVSLIYSMYKNKSGHGSHLVSIAEIPCSFKINHENYEAGDYLVLSKNKDLTKSVNGCRKDMFVINYEPV